MNFYTKQLLLYLLVVLVYLLMSIASVGNQFIYPIDDAYIHLSIAKNFAVHGSWSINNFGFDSASSSILYTLILSFLIKTLGIWDYYPLMVNIFFGSATALLSVKYFEKFYGTSEVRLSLLLLIPFSLLASMTILGMEVTLQMFLTLLVFYYLKEIELKNEEKSADFLKLNLALVLLSLTRYETIFIAAGIAFVFLLNKFWLKSLIVLISTFLPLSIFGLISLGQGGYFFPNSVLLKGNVPDGVKIFRTVIDGLFLNYSFYKWLFVPFLLMLFYLIKKYNAKIFSSLKKELTIMVVVIAGILHCIFAVLEYRYENYLMIAILLVIVPIISPFIKNLKIDQFRARPLSKILELSLVIGIFLMAIYRFTYYTNTHFTSSRSVFQQQIEMARFVNENYKNQTVAANDIGAIAYYGNSKLIDLVGLGSTEVAKFIHANRFLEKKEFQKKTEIFF